MDQLAYYKAKIKPKYWFVQITANAASQYNIRTKMMGEINNIIGICSYHTGLGPNNVTLIGAGDLSLYFVTLIQKNGENIFQKMRLDLIAMQTVASAGARTGNRFFPCNIKAKDVDLPNSFINNPGAASNSLMLGFKYI